MPESSGPHRQAEPTENVLKCLKNAVLYAEDGLVETEDRLYYHFDLFDWDLQHDQNNPGESEHRRRVLRRLQEKPLTPRLAQPLKGSWLLGIMPFMYSFYHFVRELLHAVWLYPDLPVLVSPDLKSGYREFLEHIGVELKTLEGGVYRVDQLWIPSSFGTEWSAQRVGQLKQAFNQWVPPIDLPQHRKTYISRKIVGRRNLANEAELLPILKRHGYDCLNLETIPITQQVQLMRQSTHLMAPHGAGLAHILNVPTQSDILEIRPLLRSGNFCFEKLAKEGWEGYRYHVPPQRGQFILQPEELEELLARS